MAAIATLILFAHLLWIALVVFGAFFTRRRPVWTGIHIAALAWGIAVEAGPWPCPLTLAEQYFETRAGQTAHPGGFLLHLLDSIVYPNLPGSLVTVAGVTVCVLILGVYALRLRQFLVRRQSPG